MKLTPERLAAMIRRDPVAVTYTIGSTVVTTTGLLHRGAGQRGKDEDEQAAGSVEQPFLKVLLRVVDITPNIPVEGTVMTVAGKTHRAGAVELASDQSHYVVSLLDENG